MIEIEIDTDAARLDVGLIHNNLSEHAYWCLGIPRDVVERALGGSLCFGAYDGAAQVGFARVITDGATFAYLGDVFVLPEWRGKGVARLMLAAVDAHPRLQGLRRFLLFTRDMHVLYRDFGFTPLAHPERGMERVVADVYSRPAARRTQ